MEISKEEVIKLASRYIPQSKMVDFPYTNDLFALMMQQKAPDAFPDNNKPWVLIGYGICTGYVLPEGTPEEPFGDWVHLHYVSLDRYPPAPHLLKLQPQHLVTGLFENAERTAAINIVMITHEDFARFRQYPAQDKDSAPLPESEIQKRIVPFRKKPSKK